MSSGFVTTSVLEVGDTGIAHGDEKRIESEDVNRQDYRLAQASNKPLHEQLQDQEDKKSAEYDAVSKALSDAAVGALDEEDASHLNELEDRKKSQELLRKAQASNDMNEFKFARLSTTLVRVPEDGAAATPAATTLRLPEPAQKVAALNVGISIKKKRKPPPGDKAGGAKKTAATASPVKGGLGPKDAEPAKEEGGASALSLLGGYGDSDSD